MRQLILFARPGIVTISGFVKKIIEDEHSIIVGIQNNVYLPISKEYVRKMCYVKFSDKSSVKKMRLSEGAFVVSTANPIDLNLQVVLEGGESDVMEFFVPGFNIRYNGSFDFPQLNEQKESHVFVGTVTDIKSVMYQGHPLKSMIVTFTRFGEKIKKVINCWNNVAEQEYESGKKYALVCGAPQTNKYGRTIYTARRIVSC